MKKNVYLFIVSILFWVSCEEKMSEDEVSRIGIESCRKPASFIKQLGFDPSRSAFTSTDVRTKGIALIQLPNNSSDTISKLYQDPSWAAHGVMGPITTDEQGNCYTAPIPFVNTLDNTLTTIHTIYKIDHVSGKMNSFLQLPKIDSAAGVVPFGVLGLYYDCHGKKLYASSVGGSTMEQENGHIYVIDITTTKIVDQLDKTDAMGLFVGGFTGEKKLYFGHARSSEIKSVLLNKEGEFKGKPQTELSLDGLGPRGMDKARRIRFDQYGNLMIHGIDFSFNLAAQSDRPESIYKFGYNREEKKWINMTMNP